ncbi:unconventional myosin-XV isoform X2 [Biomphalaria glabrata]|nr:unconventional myosin-XV isoform X2 [Biomphalaria glabrata]
MLDNAQYSTYDKNYTYSTVLPRKASGSSNVVVHHGAGPDSSSRSKITGSNVINVSQPEVPYVSTVPHIQKFSKNIVNTNAFVSYHLDDETGGLIETAVSPNRNYVTARSVNSTQDLPANVNTDANMNQTRHDYSEVYPKRYEYTTATLGRGDAYRPAYMKNGMFVPRANEIVHPKVIGRLPERSFSDPYVPQLSKNTRDDSDVELPRGGRKSPDGSPRRSRNAQSQERDKKHNTLPRKGVSTLSNNSSSTPREEKAPAKVNMLLKMIKHGSGRRYKRYQSLEAGDGELRGSGPTDRHVVSSLFVTIPGSKDGKTLDAEKRSARRRKKRSRKSRTLPFRYRSLDSLAQLYTNSAKYPFIPNAGSPDVVYVGQDGQLYVPDVTNTKESNYNYNGNYMYYPSMDIFNMMKRADEEDDSSDTSSSSSDSSDEDVASLMDKEILRQTRSGRSKKMSSYSDGDEKRSSSKNASRLSRSASSRKRREQRKRTSRRHSHRSGASKSSDSNDTSESEGVNKMTKDAVDSSRAKLRQQKPKPVDQVGSSNVAVHSENQNTLLQQSGFVPSNPIDNNFILSPSTKLFPNVPNPYLGFPSSTTPGPIDQILRNTHFNLASMKTYLDAMSTSLANIPFLQPQSTLQQHTDSLDRVESQDFFRSSSGPQRSSIHIRPRMTLPHEEEVYATVDSASTITDYLVDQKPSQGKKTTFNRNIRNEGTLESIGNKYTSPYGADDIIAKGTEVRAFVTPPTRRKVLKKEHRSTSEIIDRHLKELVNAKTNAAVQTDLENKESIPPNQPPIPPPLPTSERPNRLSLSNSTQLNQGFLRQQSVPKNSEILTPKSPPATLPKPRWFSIKQKKTETTDANGNTKVSSNENQNISNVPVGPNVFADQEPSHTVKDPQVLSSNGNVEQTSSGTVHPAADYDVYPRKMVSMCSKDLSQLDHFIQIDRPESAMLYNPSSLSRSRQQRSQSPGLNIYHTMPYPSTYRTNVSQTMTMGRKSSTRFPPTQYKANMRLAYSPPSYRRNNFIHTLSPRSPRKNPLALGQSSHLSRNDQIPPSYMPPSSRNEFTRPINSPQSQRKDLVTYHSQQPTKGNISLVHSPYSPRKEISYSRTLPPRSKAEDAKDFSSWHFYSPTQDRSPENQSQVRSPMAKVPGQSQLYSPLTPGKHSQLWQPLDLAQRPWHDKRPQHYSPMIQSLDLRWENSLPLMSPRTYSLEQSTLLQRRAQTQPSTVQKYASDVDLHSPRDISNERVNHQWKPPPSPLPTYSTSPSPLPFYYSQSNQLRESTQDTPHSMYLPPSQPLSPRYQPLSSNHEYQLKPPPSPLPTYSTSPSPVLEVSAHVNRANPLGDRIVETSTMPMSSPRPPLRSLLTSKHVAVDPEGVNTDAMNSEAITEFRNVPYMVYKGNPLLLNAGSNNVDILDKHLPEGPNEPSLVVQSSEQATFDRTLDGYLFYRGKSVLENRREATMSPVSEGPYNKSVEMINSSQNLASPPQKEINNNDFCAAESIPQMKNVPIPPRDFDSDADDSEYMYTLKGWSKLAKEKATTVMYCTHVTDRSSELFRKKHEKLDVIHQEFSFLSKYFDDSVPKYKAKSCNFLDLQNYLRVIPSQDLAKTSSKSIQSYTENNYKLHHFTYTMEENTFPNKYVANEVSSEDLLTSHEDSVNINDTKCDTDLTLKDYTSCSYTVVNSRERDELEMSIGYSKKAVSDRVFMKETFEMRLDQEARKIQSRAAVRLQTHIRMFIVKRRHQRLRKGALKIQRMVRMWTTRCKFNKLRNGIVLAQAQFRMLRQRRKYLKTREEIRTRLEEHKLARKKQELQDRIDKERKERQAQMMASIANLDIPGELALVYSKIDDWNPSHNGQHIITSSVDVMAMDMGYKLPVDINSHAFSKYTSIYFKNHSLGVQVEPIKTPLLPLQGDENPAKALAVFKLILRFMCDTHMSEKKEKILSDFIVQMGLKYESLRDEILCQIVNQTWLNQNLERLERLWRLLANCLCCFNPSPTLFKYLLKYVSDVGLNGYKYICQHKILQSAYMDPLLSRVYPPTFLEWQAIQRKANIGLEVKFADDVSFIGHVESWTSGELFASHLCKLRGLHENSQGWTVRLHDDAEYYELMGYDYVLDLVSEMEIAPGFPTCNAYFLVSVDRSKESIRKKGQEGPHNAEKERIFVLLGPLPEMVKRSVPVTAEKVVQRNSSKKIQTSNVEDDLGFSTTSVLNQRPTEIIPVGLSENSKMNVRYTSRSKVNGVNGNVNGGMSVITESDELNGDLSRNVLNSRYFPDGEVKNLDTSDLSKSVLNQRYNKKSYVARGKFGVPGQISRRHLSPNGDDAGNSDNTDWSHLVEDIFSSALNDHDEPNGRILGSRIKGGGNGVPGFETQQPMATGFNFNPMLGINPPPLNLAAGPTIQPVGLIGADPLQQLSAQQMAQQQAVLQAYLAQQQQQQQQQALYQAALQQQQQQQALQASQQQAQVALQASQQQTAALKTALQQQELQNKLLKQSIEQEVLKHQLQQVQMAQPIIPQALPGIIPPARPTVLPSVQPVIPQAPMSQFNALSPSSSFNSGFSALGMPNGNVTAQAHMNGTIQPEVESPRKVQFIKSNFEHRQQPEVKSPPPVAPKLNRTPSQATATGAVTRTITITSTSTADVPVMQTSQAPPLPPPVLPYNPPPLHGQFTVPPAPPPPPPPPVEIDRERGKFTIRDKSGKMKTVRIGKVVWPPPVEKEEKSNIQVGKLEIDEHVASNIEDRISGKKKWQKPTSPTDPQPKSILKSGETKRTKSLVETSHFNTMKLLEQKLGGGVSQEPAPKENDNLYEKQIVRDEPPPLPKSAPPKKIIKTTTEVIETKEMKRSSGDYAKRIEPQDASLYNKRIEPDQRPLPPLPPPEEPKQIIDYAAFERVVTELYPQNKKFFLMYSKVPWTLQVRKEVFWPSEKLEKPLTLHLIYCQIVSDVYNLACVRITKEQRIKMRSMLEGHGVNQHNYLTKDLKPQIKKVIVDTAKEWPTYFCRLFPIAASGQYSGVRYLGVSHTGLRLITRERNLVDDFLSVLEEIRFEDVIDVVLVNSSTLQLNLRTKSLIFQTTRAQQLKDMVDRFCHESEKGNKYVVAVKDYITRESTLLSFSKGEIIKLMDPEMKLENGWLYGSLNGIVGLFPAEYVSPLARHEVETSSSKPVLYQSNMMNGISSHGALSNGFTRDPYIQDDKESDTSQGTVVQDGKYSMMEFAMLNFRESLEKKTDFGISKGGADWSWKEQADLVKWTRSPIQASLLKMTSPDLNKLALECFIAIMRFMGDYPMGSNMSDFDCAKKILKTCHKYPQLRDEIFCQLCKQTTNNRSMNSKSKIRGWRLFALVAAYFDCSKELKPYLFKYLETTSTDTNRTYNNAAALCLNNLRKTFKYGGRKDVPLKEEVIALADGRNCKRIPFFYSGADTHEGMLQIKSCTVVEDAIEEVCIGLNITDPVEMEEYTFFIRTGDGTFSKLNRSDYILDETAYHIRRQMPFDFIFQRTVWYFPLKHMNNEIYVEMMFHQSVLDYIEGFLIIKSGGKLAKETEVDIAYLGALLHRANNMIGTPTLKDLEALVPRFVLGTEAKPQHWLNKIHENLAGVNRMTPLEAKARFIDVLKRWRLFGSTFFHIKNIANISNESLLAVNYEGISFLRKDTHETIRSYNFGEILSTRRYKSDANVNYLDMKLGDLMVQQILRIETDQGSEISDLIGQYMQVINRHRKRQDKPIVNGQH